jgi:branched-chain amino acid transport system permease protein
VSQVAIGRAAARLLGGLVLLYALWVLATTGGSYRAQVAVLAVIYVILASSLNLLLGYSGLLSLGHQAFFGIGAYASALLTVDAHLPMPLGVAGGAVVAGACGWMVGKITLRLRAAFFVIATFAFGEICRQVALNWASLTGGPAGFARIPPIGAGGVRLLTPEAVFPVVLLVAALVVLAVGRVASTSLGYSLRAMAENENAARAIGIDTARHANLAFVLGAVMASIAGALYAHFVGFISPEVFSFSIMINTLLMVISGGMGTVLGPVIGAVVLTALPEALRASDQWRLVIYGAVLVLLIRFLPRGLWGSLIALARRRRRAARGRAAAEPAPEPEGVGLR